MCGPANRNTVTMEKPSGAQAASKAASADRLSISGLNHAVVDLAARARANRLRLDEIQGGTFTVDNTGWFGSIVSQPIVNVPEVAILGVHKIAKRPVVRDGKIEARDMMYVSLSFDHRVFDGAYAARFVTRVIDTLQDTKKLLSEVL